MKTNQIAWYKTNAAGLTLTPGNAGQSQNGPQIDGYFMAGKKGQSGPPGNANAFRHGLAAVQSRRANGALTLEEQDIRADILAGLIADKGGEQQIGTAERILAEIISSDVALLITFNQAIDGVVKNNQKARQNPKALAQLDGYKRPLVGSLSANLQRFGMEKVAKMESLQEIIAEMGEDEETENDEH
jgi:hypothetical protein